MGGIVGIRTHEGLTVQFVGNLPASPFLPIQGNFPVYGSTGIAAPDWRPFRGSGYTLITPDETFSKFWFKAGNADTDDPGAALYLHVQVLGEGNHDLADFVSAQLPFAGTLFGDRNGYTQFSVRDFLGNAYMTSVRLNVTSNSTNIFDLTATDWLVLDDVGWSNQSLSLGPDEPTGGPAADVVPEPASWALLLLGFGGIGAALRRRSVPTAS